jgi:hypothetical protein
MGPEKSLIIFLDSLKNTIFLPPLPASWTDHGDRAAAPRAVEAPERVIFQRELAVPAIDLFFKPARMPLHMLFVLNDH